MLLEALITSIPLVFSGMMIRNWIVYRQFLSTGVVRNKKLFFGKMHTKGEKTVFPIKVLNGQIFEGSTHNENYLIKKFSIYRGVKRWTTELQPVYTSKGVKWVSVPKSYTDYSNIHTEKHIVEDIWLENMPLNITDKTVIKLPANVCKIYPTTALKYFNIINFIDYKFDKARKYEFYDTFIENNDQVAIFGAPSKRIVDVEAVGNKYEVMDYVKSNEIWFSYIALALGISATFGTGLFLYYNPIDTL